MPLGRGNIMQRNIPQSTTIDNKNSPVVNPDLISGASAGFSALQISDIENMRAQILSALGELRLKSENMLARFDTEKKTYGEKCKYFADIMAACRTRKRELVKFGLLKSRWDDEQQARYLADFDYVGKIEDATDEKIDEIWRDMENHRMLIPSDYLK